ncbi:hypothetical protein PHYPSEUDO_011081 [Phytophthora pseudosyringae]|uniref:DUF6604 domain-containing protein n=1 Tax=Phytophthora pseudosyringae TaxID=221518 RepID=A0A8T1WAN0_9STRA|nr:hypothetical protein PHYPSEUDO_011081 [Phytophthora pseudosyringae]
MSSFPVGKYARYKRATAFFLDWLLRARGRGRYAGNHVDLETLSDVVQEIAEDPSTLTPKLLQDLPKALAAGQCAIALREHVATFFPQEDKAQVGHRHFTGLLRSWLRTLNGVEIARSDHVEESERTKFATYYEVLQPDEDFLPDDTNVVKAEAPKRAKVDTSRLLEEAFADEMRMEVISFFAELDELMQSVYNVYVAVKKEKRSLVEATVVAKVAMDTASALTAQLQLKYPSLRTGQNVYEVVKNIDPDTFRQRMAAIHTKYLTDLQQSLLNGDGVAPYESGMFLMDFLGVGTTLASFLTAIPVDPTKRVNFPVGSFGDVYGEDRTPDYVLLPDPSKTNVFLLQQLPLLHKTIAEKKRSTGSGYDPCAPMDSFMLLLEKYFTTREVTVPVVFACICWMKSVAALQGNAGLGRNVSLTFKHSTGLTRNIDTSVAKGAVRKAHKKSNDVLQLCADEMKGSTPRRYLARANPLLAGLTMLDHHFKYLHVASEILLVTSRFRSFGHLYNALVKESYLERIPMLDDTLEVYNDMIFTPSRAAATRGAYYRTLLLSVDLRTTSVDAVCRGEALPAGNGKFRKRKAFHLSDVSKTYRLMIKNDKSVLEGTSWADILDGVANICTRELFETRVLSRDLLTLNDVLAEMYADLCDEFKPYHNTITGSTSDQNHEQRQLEDGVIMVLLQLLDVLKPGESLDMAIKSNDEFPAARNIGIEEATTMCKKAAAVIRNKFAPSPLICVRKYFTFPSQPDLVSQEYESAAFEVAKDKNKREHVFFDVMKLLQNSNGPLTGSDMRFLKSEIKKDPELLGMTVPSPRSSFASEKKDNAAQDDGLYTLLHQAAAGPAHDAELVEWMIQMGALAVQLTQEPQQKELSYPGKCLPNTLAVHSAGIAGYVDIVQIILEADNFVDLNTPIRHTKETLAHLAVKHGHRGLLNTLVWFGADLRMEDGRGRRVCDVTTDADWANNIAAYTAHAFRNSIDGVGKRKKRVCSQEEERRRKFAADQGDENDTSLQSPSSAKGSKKRSSKKKTKTGKASPKKKTSNIVTASCVATGNFGAESRFLQCLST